MEDMKVRSIKERLPKPNFTHSYAKHNLHILAADVDPIPNSVDLRNIENNSYISHYLLAVDLNAGGYGNSKDTIKFVDYEAKDFCITPEQATDWQISKHIRFCSYINVHVHI